MDCTACVGGQCCNTRSTARFASCLFQLNRHLIDLPRELVIALLIVVRDWRLAIDADIGTLIGREDVGLRLVDLRFDDLFVVDENRADATLA